MYFRRYQEEYEERMKEQERRRWEKERRSRERTKKEIDREFRNITMHLSTIYIALKPLQNTYSTLAPKRYELLPLTFQDIKSNINIILEHCTKENLVESLKPLAKCDIVSWQKGELSEFFEIFILAM
jgi:hypothetical protein